MGNTIVSAVVRFKDALPKLRGEIKLPEELLAKPITLSRDANGVIHIIASTYTDATLAMGYAHAQDRIFSLFMLRRLLHGRLAETVGNKNDEALVDKLALLYGWAKLGQSDYDELAAKYEGHSLNSEHVQKLQSRPMHELSDDELNELAFHSAAAYASGVNAFIEECSREGLLPAELKLLDVDLINWWHPAEMFKLSRFLSWQLTYGGESSLLRAKLASIVGDEYPDILNQWVPLYSVDNTPLHVPDSMEGHPFQECKVASAADRMSRYCAETGNEEIKLGDHDWLRSTVADIKGLPSKGKGSNSWTISGKLTESGRPILCSDPHLALTNPGIWIVQHIVVKPMDLNIFGIGVAGAPILSIARSSYIAWGITLSMCSIEDVWYERVNLKSMEYEETFGEWKPLQKEEYEIKVQGKESLKYTVLRTSRGAIISEELIPMIGKSMDEAANQHRENEDQSIMLSISSMAFSPDSRSSIGYFKMMGAKDFEGWRSGVQQLTEATLNITYADVHGNIGYQMSGRIPIRGDKNLNLVPYPGWDPDYQWKGTVPAEDLPFSYNPECGYLVSANHIQVDYQKYPHFLGQKHYNAYRAKVIHMHINNWIEAGHKISIRDCEILQNNLVSLHAVHFMKLVGSSFSAKEEDFQDVTSDEQSRRRVKTALRLLYDWGQKAVEGTDAEAVLDGACCRLGLKDVGASVYGIAWPKCMQTIITHTFTPPSIIKKDTKEYHNLISMAYNGATNHTLAPFGEWEGWIEEKTLDMMRSNSMHYVEKDSEGNRKKIKLEAKQVLFDALNDAIKFLQKHYGSSENERWQWGHVHRMSFSHEFSKAVGNVSPFNEGPYPWGGDGNTVRMSSLGIGIVPNDPEVFGDLAPVSYGASWRMVCDMIADTNALRAPNAEGDKAAPDKSSEFSIPLGNSARLTSPFRNNLSQRWLDGTYFNMIRSPETIKTMGNTIKITPSQQAPRLPHVPWDEASLPVQTKSGSCITM